MRGGGGAPGGGAVVDYYCRNLLREGDPRETFCLPQGYPEAPAEQECGKVVKPSKLKEGAQREMGQSGNSEMGCRYPTG